MCDIGQITFPFGGIFFTHTRRQLNPLGASQVMVHKPLGFEASKDSVDRMIPQAPPRPMKSESLATGPRNMHFNLMPLPPHTGD